MPRLSILLIITLHLVQSIYVNFMDVTSDNALTYNGKGLSLVKHGFNNPQQLWKFDISNVLKTKSGKMLGYNTSTNNTLLEDNSPGDIQWSVQGGKITATKAGIALCLQFDVTKMGSCDGNTFKSLILVEDNSLVDVLVKIENDTVKYNKLMNKTLAIIMNIEVEISNSAQYLSMTEKKLEDFTSQLSTTYNIYTTNSTSALGNLSITQSRFKRLIDKLNTDISDLNAVVQNVSTRINSTTFNFTKIEDETNELSQKAQLRLASTLKFMEDEIALKSKQGHIVPNSIYDFIVIFLTLLGVINVADLFRRLWGCAVNGKDIKILYAQT